MNELEPGSQYLLACSDEDYFSAIKPSPVYLSKLEGLKEYLPEASSIVSLGMAGGEDLCTLAKIYGEHTRLIGVDISPVALEIARRTTTAAGVQADFIESNASELSLPNRSIDGFVLSAVLHEVYSYAEDGKQAFVKSVGETYRKTALDGCIFISDFAAPRVEGIASVLPQSKEAKHFIDYFVKNFRKFNDAEPHADVPLDSYAIPYVAQEIGSNGQLRATVAFVSELLWHFKHFMKNFDSVPDAGNDIQGWKEINEVYNIPNPFVAVDRPMPTADYARTVLRICQNAETSSDAALSCVSTVVTSQKPGTIDMLDKHFTVVLDDNDVTSKRLIAECTNWMDLIFKKELV